MSQDNDNTEVAQSNLFDPLQFVFRTVERGVYQDMQAFDKGGLPAYVMSLAASSDGNLDSDGFKSARAMAENPSWEEETRQMWREYIKRTFTMVAGLKSQGVTFPRLGTDDLEMYNRFKYQVYSKKHIENDPSYQIAKKYRWGYW